jgi:hypothetical protein
MDTAKPYQVHDSIVKLVILGLIRCSGRLPNSDAVDHVRKCQTGSDPWRDVTPAVPSWRYYKCLSPCCLEESVLGNSLYTSARYARRWGGGDVAQVELGTPARGHLADGGFVYL